MFQIKQLSYYSSLFFCLLTSQACAQATEPGIQAEHVVTSQVTLQKDVDDLLHLIDQRLAVARLVAESKWNSGAPIDDPKREQQILESIKEQAKQQQIRPDLALSFFQSQFDAGKQEQRHLHAMWTQQHLPPFSTAPDLARDVRPVLDKLAPAMLEALKHLQDNLCREDFQGTLQKESQLLLAPSWDDDTRKVAISALTCH